LSEYYSNVIDGGATGTKVKLEY